MTKIFYQCPCCCCLFQIHETEPACSKASVSLAIVVRCCRFERGRFRQSDVDDGFVRGNPPNRRRLSVHSAGREEDEERKTRQDLTADAVIDWIRDKGTIAEALPWPTCILIEMPQSPSVRAGPTLLILDRQEK